MPWADDVAVTVPSCLVPLTTLIIPPFPGAIANG